MHHFIVTVTNPTKAGADRVRDLGKMPKEGRKKGGEEKEGKEGEDGGTEKELE